MTTDTVDKKVDMKSMGPTRSPTAIFWSSLKLSMRAIRSNTSRDLGRANTWYVCMYVRMYCIYAYVFTLKVCIVFMYVCSTYEL